MTDTAKVLALITNNPGLRTSNVVALLDLPKAQTLDAIWELWDSGRVEVEIDWTLRATRDDEKIFRWRD